jgi:hypothetical protein
MECALILRATNHSSVPEATDRENVTLQLETERRSVGYDSYDMSVRELLTMAAQGELNIAPEYQRKFVWNSERQSQLIESVLLGIPVPPLFMATNRDGTWEAVDGVQRICSLIHFGGSDEQRQKINRTNPLVLDGLEKLTALNGLSFSDLPKSVQLSFMTRSMRVPTLNDKSDMNVRFDLFERLNSGGVALQPQEIRNCVYHGPFKQTLKDLAADANFKRVVKLDKAHQHNGTDEDFVLRFLAYYEGYRSFDHNVNQFLNGYMAKANNQGTPKRLLTLFSDTFRFLATELPLGIVRQRGSTPVNLFEALSVGTALVLAAGKRPRTGVLPDLLNNNDLKAMTSGGTNNRRMVSGRIEFVRDHLA